MKPSLTAILPFLPTIHIIDIGAALFGDPPYLPLLKIGAGKLIGFEPDLDALVDLNQQKSVVETYLPYAVGDGKQHTYYQCESAVLSSLLYPNQQVLSQFHGYTQWSRVTNQTLIQTHRLDDLEEIQQMDYLKIDIQGGELMVFQNATQKLQDCLVIQTEVQFLQMYENQALFSEIELFLRKQGFIFHKFHPLVSKMVKPLMNRNNVHAGMSQLLEADAIFIKNFMALEKLSNEALLKYALILHDLYQSYDIALKALIEYDGRMGTNYSRLYAEKILGA